MAFATGKRGVDAYRDALINALTITERVGIRGQTMETLNTFAILVHGTTLGTDAFKPVAKVRRYGKSPLPCDGVLSCLQAGKFSFEFLIGEYRGSSRDRLVQRI